MLSKEDNETITRVGPGTTMGNLMRQYWVPALMSSELPQPDCDPVRVMLLGEQLIAFRDTDGRVGLIQDKCPHRGASLFFGRNGECGIRCVYHGWQFDIHGNCIDMPNEPEDSDFKHKVKAVTYPCVERGGLVWTYMGTRETPPPLPDIEVNQLPDGEYTINPTMLECNWLQAVEGEIDTSHSGFLHFGSITPEDTQEGTYLYYTVKDRAPRYSVVDTDYGVMYGAYRPAKPGWTYWRIAQFMFPFFTQSPEGILGNHVITNAWVPMDDTHTMSYIIIRKVSSESGWPGRHPIQGTAANYPTVQTPTLPNTTDWFGRFRSAVNASNDYGLDRDRQRSGLDYSGIPYLPAQDRAVQESMGPIYDRTQEHLAISDAMVIRVRRRLLAAARGLAEKQVVPPGVDSPAVYRNRSGSTLLPEGADWIEATKELRKAFVDHPEVLQQQP
ncbi:Rieske 2Fe-2S domain-containing protein [Alicyclobacillus dauci]|uniref:Rieske 2Fe-2S domain-containing protein n=1 Tax=Alicyclobacillus dauci TaxID=1475485 RepID=A0ABY6YYM4_9BACL|nr:Rieske 2Fe-2S domain-containing protein [Alicyclobacillus dauci]WAH35687.1 Rieske 2Fe-2S domain-containing protein [Alicyclobacillus dauci]